MTEETSEVQDEHNTDEAQLVAWGELWRNLLLREPNESNDENNAAIADKESLAQ
jgi:hypothetical protein